MQERFVRHNVIFIFLYMKLRQASIGVTHLQLQCKGCFKEIFVKH